MDRWRDWLLSERAGGRPARGSAAILIPAPRITGKLEAGG
jgi:hypothetical protein